MGNIGQVKLRFKEMSTEEKEAFYLKLMAVRRKKLVKLSEAQNHRCCYCGCKTWLYELERELGMTKGQMATIEHVVAQTYGGTDNFHNTVMACSRCNTLRGHFEDAIQFFEIVNEPNGIRKFKLMRQNRTEEEMQAKAERDRCKQEKRLVKRDKFALDLGILFFYFPSLKEEFLSFL